MSSGELVKKLRLLKSRLLDLRSYHYLSKNSKKKAENKLRIGFIVQMPEIWDKELDVYEEMKSRENIEVVLLVVPMFDFSLDKQDVSYQDNYFIKNYPDSIKAVNPDGSVIDIKRLKLDCIFFSVLMTFIFRKS